MIILLTLFTSVTISLLFFFSKFLARRDPKKILDIYSQPGKWFYLKYYYLVLVLSLRKIKSKIFPTSTGLGKHLSKGPEALEKLQPLSGHEKAFDAVFFQGVNKEGYYFCGGIERRHQGKANGLFYIVVPGLGLLRSEKLPYTVLDQDADCLHFMKKYGAEGIQFERIEAMKSWRVCYRGKMTLKGDPSGRLYDVKLEAEWTYEKFPCFIFDSELSVQALARAISREPWSKQLFENLKSSHQSHYEQMGKLSGTLMVDEDKHEITMDSFRDHSFGHKRDWSLMHRYAFHMMYLENGTRVSLGVICQPCTTSHLEVGYVVLPNKKIHPIDSCDLLLYQHGENGNPGKNIAFSFVADGTVYDVKVKTEYECEHFKGNDVEARLIERFNSYEVNGVKGRGISEWHYNNVKV